MEGSRPLAVQQYSTRQCLVLWFRRPCVIDSLLQWLTTTGRSEAASPFPPFFSSFPQGCAPGAGGQHRRWRIHSTAASHTVPTRAKHSNIPRCVEVAVWCAMLVNDIRLGGLVVAEWRLQNVITVDYPPEPAIGVATGRSVASLVRILRVTKADDCTWSGPGGA